MDYSVDHRPSSSAPDRLDDGAPTDERAWPPNPVRVDGVLRVSLFGLDIARIRLDLTIRAASWVIDQATNVLSNDRLDRES